jgi:K+-sensing histidine kinase KdpD
MATVSTTSAEPITSAGQWSTAARAAAAVFPLVTCAILSSFRQDVPAATSVLILVLWVVAAAATGDRLAGLVAAVSSGAWFDFFLTEPYQRFTIDSPDDIEAAVLLVLIGIAVTEIALWGRRQQARASARSGYLEGVLRAANSVSVGEIPPSAVIDVVARQIAELLDADSCRFVPGPVNDPRIALLDHEGVLTRDGHVVDVDRLGLPYNEYLAIVVRRGQHMVGHFLVTATARIAYPSREQRRVAVLLADQLAGLADTR